MTDELRRTVTETWEEVGLKRDCYRCKGTGRNHRCEMISEAGPYPPLYTAVLYVREMLEGPCQHCNGAGYVVDWVRQFEN